MYNFIFWIIYSRQIEKGRSHGFARYNAVLAVAFALIVHMCFLVGIYKKIRHTQTLFANYHVDKNLLGIFVIFLQTWFICTMGKSKQRKY